MTFESDLLTWVSQAKSAISAAVNLEQLKLARLAHAGDKSPIALASRSLGSMDPQDRATFGKIIGDARAQVAAIVSERTSVLEEERDARVLLDEIVDITLPASRSQRGALHPEPCKIPFLLNHSMRASYFVRTLHRFKFVQCLKTSRPSM